MLEELPPDVKECSFAQPTRKPAMLSPSTKRVRLFDERGLYLEVSPAGGKWWRLKYRFGGKEKRLSLGVYPDVSLKDARDRRDDARKLIGRLASIPSDNRKANEGRVKSIGRQTALKL